MSTEHTRTQVAASRALLFGVGFSFGFTLLIWLAGSRLDVFELRPDRNVAFWYPWVTKVPTFLTRLSAWGLYVAHQLAVWGLIWYAQTKNTKYSSSLSRINLIALFANALFIVLHFVQTHGNCLASYPPRGNW